MEFFNKAKSVRLRSHANKYLVADDDEETVRQSPTGSSRKVRWVVELVPGKSNVIRLKGCHGRYLTASGEAFLFGLTGRKVVQTLPTPKMDASTEWQPISDGFQVKLRANGGKFLRANGGTPPWRDSVTHDVPHRTVTQEWVLWSVDIVDISEFDTPVNYISPASSFSSLREDFTSSDTGSPAIGSRLASNRQIPAQEEDDNERSNPQMDHDDKAKACEKTNFMTPSKAREKTFEQFIPAQEEDDNERSSPQMDHDDKAKAYEGTNFMTPSKAREKTFDAVCKISIDQEASKGRSKPGVQDVNKAFDQTNFNSLTPRKQNSKPSDQTDYTPPKLRDQTYDLDQSPKARDVAPSTIPTPISSSAPSVVTTASVRRKSSTSKDDHLNSVFSELESIVSDVGSCSTSFSEPRMEDDEAAEISALPSKEEIRQALAALKECLLLEFSQLKERRVRAKFILALSTLSIAKGSLSQEQMEASHYFQSNFNALIVKFDRAERQLVECNNFLRDKNLAYDDLRVINESNLDLKARIDQLDDEEEELLRKIEEIRGMKTKLVNKRMELGEESKSALSKWNEFGSLEPTVLSRQKKFEKRRDEIVEDWSNLKVLFN